MVFISPGSLSMSLSFRTIQKFFMQCKHKWLEQWKGKPPGASDKHCCLHHSYLLLSRGPYMCLTVFFPAPLFTWKAWKTTYRHNVLFHLVLCLLCFITCHTSTPSLSQNWRKKSKFYINRQICKKLLEINNVSLALSLSAQF